MIYTKIKSGQSVIIFTWPLITSRGERIFTPNRQFASMLQWMSRLIPIAFEFYAIAGRDKEVRQFLKKYFTDYRRLLARLIERGIAQGELRDIDAVATAITLVAPVRGAGTAVFRGPRGDPMGGPGRNFGAVASGRAATPLLAHRGGRVFARLAWCPPNGLNYATRVLPLLAVDNSLSPHRLTNLPARAGYVRRGTHVEIANAIG
jgi:BetI-type transcriptional repressor, C-terminal